MTRCKGAAVWFGRLAVATTLLAVTSTSSSHRPPLSSAAAFAVLRPWDLLRNSGRASRIGNRCALSAARMRSGPVKGEVRNPWGRAGKPETRAVRQREAEDNAQLRAKAWRQALSKVRPANKGESVLRLVLRFPDKHAEFLSRWVHRPHETELW